MLHSSSIVVDISVRVDAQEKRVTQSPGNSATHAARAPLRGNTEASQNGGWEACLPASPPSAHMNTGWLLHAGALLLCFRLNLDVRGNSSFNGVFPSRELLCVDCSHIVQARRQRGTALAVRKWLLYTKWIQICNSMKPFLHHEWRAVAVPAFLLYAVPEIQILGGKSMTYVMGKYALPSSPVQVELRWCFGSSVRIKCWEHVGSLSGECFLYS